MRALLMIPVLATLAGAATPAPAQTADATKDLALGIRQVDEGELETAVVTLASVTRALSAERGREKDLSVAHLYLSMAYLGLSEWEVAKANMRLAWKNDRAMKLDPKQFPPRLLQLYEDIRREGAEAPPAASASAPPPPSTSTVQQKKGSSTPLIVGAAVGGAALAGGAVALANGDDGAPRTDTFPFTLAAASTRSAVVGPVRAKAGTVTVTLAFAGDYIILACVGTASRCIPMGGRPQTRTFDIPGDFPAGPIQAQVYFNTNFPQPPGDATGTVSFTYEPM